MPSKPVGPASERSRTETTSRRDAAAGPARRGDKAARLT